MIFGLWTALGGHGAPGIELAHNVRSPEEVDAVLADAERAGATIIPSVGAESGLTESGLREGQADARDRAGMRMEQVEGSVRTNDWVSVSRGGSGRHMSRAIERASEEG